MQVNIIGNSKDDAKAKVDASAMEDDIKTFVKARIDAIVILTKPKVDAEGKQLFENGVGLTEELSYSVVVRAVSDQQSTLVHVHAAY